MASNKANGDLREQELCLQQNPSSDDLDVKPKTPVRSLRAIAIKLGLTVRALLIIGVLVLILLLFLILVIVLALQIPSSDDNKPIPVCTSPACLQAAARVSTDI